MNTERLRGVLRLLIDLNNSQNIVKLLQNIENTYTQSVQAPAPANAQVFNDAMQALDATAKSFPIDRVSPSRRKILEAIGGTDYYGDNLLSQINEIIYNSSTPSEALQKIQNFRSKLADFYPNVQSLDDNLAKLGIGVEAIPRDSAEVEIFIPNSVASGHLDNLRREARFLNHIISDFQEIATSHRDPLEIRGLNSGSFEVFITVDLITGEYILNFVTAIILLSVAILGARRDRDSLKQRKAPKAIIQNLQQWEETLIKAEIDRLREELLAHYKGSEGRKSELSNSLSLNLKGFVNRIDKGMEIDVTTEAAEDSIAGDGTPEDTLLIEAKKASIRYIREHAGNIKDLPSNHEPILQLSSSEKEVGEVEGEEEGEGEREVVSDE